MPTEMLFQVAESPNGLSDNGTAGNGLRKPACQDAFAAGEILQIGVTAVTGQTFDLASFTFDISGGFNAAQDFAFRASTDGGVTFELLLDLLTKES